MPDTPAPPRRGYHGEEAERLTKQAREQTTEKMAAPYLAAAQVSATLEAAAAVDRLTCLLGSSST